MIRTAPGFTLIELLIVILLMSILGSVVFAAADPVKRKAQARDAGRKSEIGQIVNALKAYYTTNDTYPTPSGLGTKSGLTTLTSSGDLKFVPLDPLGNEFTYAVSGSGVDSNAALYIELESPTSSSKKKNDTWVWCWSSLSPTIGETEEADCQP